MPKKYNPPQPYDPDTQDMWTDMPTAHKFLYAVAFVLALSLVAICLAVR